MAETLFIRLASKQEQAISWLVWSTSEREIIASGELANASALTELTEKANQRKVVALVPANDVSLKRLQVPGKSQRARQMAAPYMLEDDLAQDVEQLFFAYATSQSDTQDANCLLAAVEREQLEQWLAWLAAADISAQKMLPDALALPHETESWTSVKLGQQYLFRQGFWQVMTVDQALWPVVAELALASEREKLASKDQDNSADDHTITVNSYAELEAIDGFEIVQQPEELPLALLAQHAEQTSFNLLQGPYQVKTKRSPMVKSWLLAAGIAGLALLLNLGYKGAKLYQLNQEQAAIEQQIIDRYKQVFPQTKKVRLGTIRSQLKQKLAGISSANNDAHFLTLLARLEPAFARVPQLKPESLKYDNKRQELRIQAIASNYQQFEQFKNQLERLQLKVSQGSQNNQGDQVTGSFSIKAG